MTTLTSFRNPHAMPEMDPLLGRTLKCRGCELRQRAGNMYNVPVTNVLRRVAGSCSFLLANANGFLGGLEKGTWGGKWKTQIGKKITKTKGKRE